MLCLSLFLCSLIFSLPWNSGQGGPFIGSEVFWWKELVRKWRGVASARMGWRAPLPLACARNLWRVPPLVNSLCLRRSRWSPKVSFRWDMYHSNILSHGWKPWSMWHVLATGSNQHGFRRLRWTTRGVTWIGDEAGYWYFLCTIKIWRIPQAQRKPL